MAFGCPSFRHGPAQLDAQLAAQAQIATSERGKEEVRELSEQIDLLREERQTIRGRVSQMLEMMAGLEEGGGEARREH